MPFEPNGFLRFLQPLNRHAIDRAVERHQGNRGVGKGEKAWTCQRHMKALLFAQLTDLNSLREIEQGLDSKRSWLYHPDLRAARRSTLSDAMALRPAAVFRDICLDLMGQVSRQLRREGDAIVRLLDSTPIQLRSAGFDWAQSDPHTTGLKLHFVYDPRGNQPVQLDITSPRVNDVTMARQFSTEAGSTWVFDKAYTDYDWWHRLVTAETVFVTRLKRNAKMQVIAEAEATGEAILSDRRVRIGHKQPRGGKLNPLYDVEMRVIEVERPDRAPLRLVTNDHARSAVEIAELYKQRWQIELFFKWIKQNLRIKSFLGRSENAVRIQIYAAIIAFLLLRLLQHAQPKGSTQTLKAIRTLLRINVLNAFEPPPRRPKSIHAQMELCLNPPSPRNPGQ